MVLDRRKKESQLLRRLAAAVEAAVHRSGANQEEPGSEAKPRAASAEPRAANRPAARQPGDRTPQLRWRGACALAVTGGLS